MGGRRGPGNLDPISLRLDSAKADCVTKNEAVVDVD
jgi:hypothetical protein